MASDIYVLNSWQINVIQACDMNFVSKLYIENAFNYYQAHGYDGFLDEVLEVYQLCGQRI